MVQPSLCFRPPGFSRCRGLMAIRTAPRALYALARRAETPGPPGEGTRGGTHGNVAVTNRRIGGRERGSATPESRSGSLFRHPIRRRAGRPRQLGRQQPFAGSRHAPVGPGLVRAGAGAWQRCSAPARILGAETRREHERERDEERSHAGSGAGEIATRGGPPNRPLTWPSHADPVLRRPASGGPGSAGPQAAGDPRGSSGRNRIW